MILGQLQAQGCLFDCLGLVVGNQEKKVQYETGMSKEEAQAKIDNSENIEAIGLWSQERVYL